MPNDGSSDMKNDINLTTLKEALAALGYLLMEKIGQGGFGQVFKAKNQRTQQLVAVKLVKIQGDDETAIARMRARFHRELRLSAQLEHPNVVRLIDHGEIDALSIYGIFQYVPGQTLRQFLRRYHRLSYSEALHLMAQVLDALCAAHALGIVHRDIKPENIMITSTGGRNNAMMLDFGLGVLVDDTLQPAASRLTRSLEVLGTPAYAAPEQLRGGPCGPSADLYSWGLVFCECLTGEPLIQGGSVYEVLRQQCSGEPLELPRSLSLHPLGELLQQVLVRQPEKRLISAQELLQALLSLNTQSMALHERLWHSKQLPLERRPQLTRTFSISSSEHETTLVPYDLETAIAPAESLSTRETAVSPREQRMVSFLTVLPEVVSPDGGAPALEPYARAMAMLLGLMSEVVTVRKAHVMQLSSEQLVVCLGYPRSEELHAVHAVKLGLALQQLLLRTHPSDKFEGLEVRLRMGAASGMVLCARLPGAMTVAGELISPVIGQVHRLAAEAQPGEIRVSEDMATLLERHFLVVPVEGYEQAQLTPWKRSWRVLEQFPSLGERLEAMPLVGRAAELSRLQQLWSSASEGHGRALLLSGEPGIGKSRLVMALREFSSQDSMRLLELRCSSEQRLSPLAPVIALLETLIELPRAAPKEQQLAALELTLAAYQLDPTIQVPLFAGLLNVDTLGRFPPLPHTPARQRALLFEGIVCLLCTLSEDKPVLLLVEDLHWADESSQALLEQLSKSFEGASFLLLMTMRSPVQLSWLSSVEHLPLSSLRREASQQLMESLARHSQLTPALRESILEQCDGVPLYLEELVRLVTATSRLKGTVREQVPGTLHATLMQRLEQMGPVLPLAQLAAVLGRDFTQEQLAAVCTLQAEALLEGLRLLEHAGLVVVRRRRNERLYAFKHALLRDVAYLSLSEETRRMHHLNVARRLEVAFPELPEQEPQLFLHHYERALCYELAFGYGLRSISRLAQRHAQQEALELGLRCRSWLTSLPESERVAQELSLNTLIQPLIMATQGFSVPLLREVLERSLLLAADDPACPQLFPSLWALVIYHYGQAQLDDALSLAQHFLALSEQSSDATGEQAACTALGQVLLGRGELQKAEAMLRRALGVVPDTLPEQAAQRFGLNMRLYACVNLVVTLQLQGQLESAAFFQQCLRAEVGDSQHPHLLSALYFGEASHWHLLGRHALILPLSDAMRGLVAKYGFSFYFPLLELLRSWADKDTSRALEQYHTLIAYGGVSGRGYWAAMVAQLMLGEQRCAEARSLLEPCLQHLTDGSAPYGANILRLYALSQEEEGAQLAGLETALELAQAQGARLFQLRAALDWADLQQKRGEPSRGAQKVREALAGMSGWQGLPEASRITSWLAR